MDPHHGASAVVDFRRFFGRWNQAGGGKRRVLFLWPYLHID
jgi:hypothetical protein